MVDDAADAVGEPEHGAHPGEVGAEPGEERLARRCKQAGRVGYSLVERGRTAGDPRRRVAYGALEALAGAMTAGGANLDAARARCHRQIIAKQAAERAGHVLPQLCRRTRAHGRPRAPGSVVILDVGEALVAVGRALQPGAILARLPLHHVLDLAREGEVLVGDALGRMVL